MLKKIETIVFWSVFAILMTVWLTDLFMVKSQKAPVFCISNETHTYDDGEVTECTGLGYKVFHYNRESLTKGYEFGPFFIKMKE